MGFVSTESWRVALYSKCAPTTAPLFVFVRSLTDPSLCLIFPPPSPNALFALDAAPLQLETFATLSPIPSFRSWLGKKAKHRAALGVDHSELSGGIRLSVDLITHGLVVAIEKEKNVLAATAGPRAFLWSPSLTAVSSSSYRFADRKATQT